MATRSALGRLRQARPLMPSHTVEVRLSSRERGECAGGAFLSRSTIR